MSAEKPWVVFRHGDIDVVPMNDDLEHIAGAECPCHPRVEVYGASILCVHNAFDYREYFEEANEIIGVSND